MSIRKIVTLPDPVLRKQALKVKNFDADLQNLADDMLETLRAAPGVGLAAPQVGVSQRLILVEYADEPDDPDDPEAPPKLPKLFVMVNPEILRHSTETVSGNEGCLSIPGYLGEVERYQSVTVKGFNARGKPLRVKAEGWLARIFQHEIDHLNGVLFIDRAAQVWKVEDEETVQVSPVQGEKRAGLSERMNA
ncbi:MAG TPA: peptide deformylase [Anaerolineales bacterium]|nr:peptide deformylase [Anaerolineales bacterium]